MKNSKTNLLLMATLIAIQTVAHAKDENRDDKKQPRTWRQAAYDNRYGLAAGSAAVGLGALGYVYGGDFMTWFNSLSSADQAKAQDVLEKSVEKDLQVIEEKQEVVAEKIDNKKHGVAQQKAIAKEEQAIAQVQQQVAQKQTWLQYFSNMRANDPALQKIQAGIDRQNAEHAAENSDYRSSDLRSDADREEYQRDLQYTKDKLRLRNEGPQLPKNKYEIMADGLPIYGEEGKKFRDLHSQYTKELLDSDPALLSPSDAVLAERIKQTGFNYPLYDRDRARIAVTNSRVSDLGFDLAPFREEAQADYKLKEQAIDDAYNAEPTRTGGSVSNFLSDYNPLSPSRNAGSNNTSPAHQS